MFHNTAKGAGASALVYSISETAKLNNLHPYYYFRHILTELPNILITATLTHHTIDEIIKYHDLLDIGANNFRFKTVTGMTSDIKLVDEDYDRLATMYERLTSFILGYWGENQDTINETKCFIYKNRDCLKMDLRFPIPGQQGHGGRIIHNFQSG